jgi:hypothetical protein
MDLVRVSDGFVESSSESDHVAGRIGSLAGCPEAGKSLIGEPEILNLEP